MYTTRLRSHADHGAALPEIKDWDSWFTQQTLEVQEAQLIWGPPVVKPCNKSSADLSQSPLFPEAQRRCCRSVTHADDADVDAKLSAPLGHCYPFCPAAPVLWQMQKPSAGRREPSY